MDRPRAAREALETLFTQLADENGEDEGRNEGKGYLINEATNFVQRRVLGQLQQMLVVVAGGGHPVKVLLGDAHFPQVVHKVLLASQLFGVGGPVLLNSGLVLIGEGDLVGKGSNDHEKNQQRASGPVPPSEPVRGLRQQG